MFIMTGFYLSYFLNLTFLILMKFYKLCRRYSSQDKLLIRPCYTACPLHSYWFLLFAKLFKLLDTAHIALHISAFSLYPLCPFSHCCSLALICFPVYLSFQLYILFVFLPTLDMWNVFPDLPRLIISLFNSLLQTISVKVLKEISHW